MSQHGTHGKVIGLDACDSEGHTYRSYFIQKRKPRTSTSKSASVVEIESSVQPEDSGEDTPGKGKKRKSRQSNASQASQGGKRRRIEDSDESSASLPPPLSTLRKSPSKRRKSPSPPSSVAPVPDMPMEAALPGLRSPTHSSRGGTPAPLAATSRTNDATDDDMEAFFAPYRRNFVKDEPQSPGRPPGHIKLYTGQTFDSRDEFVNAVLQHTEQRNPGCRLSVANTDPARVRVYCMRADCAYSFNSVYEHGARRIPAVKVTAVRINVLETPFDSILNCFLVGRIIVTIAPVVCPTINASVKVNKEFISIHLWSIRRLGTGTTSRVQSKHIQTL